MPEIQTETAGERDRARLTQHMDHLDRLIRLCQDGDGECAETATVLHQNIRIGLRRDYDAGDRRALTMAESVTQAALYGAQAELSAGSIRRSERMLTEARKARRVLAGALAGLERRR